MGTVKSLNGWSYKKKDTMGNATTLDEAEGDHMLTAMDVLNENNDCEFMQFRLTKGSAVQNQQDEAMIDDIVVDDGDHVTM